MSRTNLIHGSGRHLSESAFPFFGRNCNQVIPPRSNSSLRDWLHRNSDHAIFRAGNPRHGTIKYSTYDIFGVRGIRVDYDPHNPQPLIDQLVGMFLAKNPNPIEGVRHAFSQMLHAYGLHWNNCYHDIHIPRASKGLIIIRRNKKEIAKFNSIDF